MLAYEFALLLLLVIGSVVLRVGLFLRFQRLPLAELCVVAGEVLYLAFAAEHEQVIYNLVHEEAVVRHDYHAAGEVLQILLKHLERLYVEVVGRLVEHEEVGVAHQHRAQIELATLAAGELVDVVVLLLGRKEKVLQKLRCGDVFAAAVVDVVGDVGYHVNDALVVAELHSVLREVAEAHGVAHVEASAVGRHFAEQHLYECRLARAVVAHDAHLLEALEVVVEVLQYHLLVERFRDVLALEYLRTDVHVLRLQAHLSLLDALLRLALKVVERLLAVACLVSACLRLAAHPLEFAAVEVVGALYLGACGVDALLTFLHVVLEVAAI